MSLDGIIARLDALAEDMAEVKADAKEIKAQGKETNGRVTTLERWRIGIDVRQQEREAVAARDASARERASDKRGTRWWAVALLGIAAFVGAVADALTGLFKGL